MPISEKNKRLFRENLSKDFDAKGFLDNRSIVNFAIDAALEELIDRFFKPGSP